MDRGMSYLQIILTCNGILLIIVGYFVNKLVNKVDDTARAITNIDKSVAVLVEKTKQHESRFEYMEAFERRMDLELKSIREKLHQYGNELNAIELLKHNCNMNHGGQHE